MKRLSLVAAAAMLLAGAQLHAQQAKQDTTKKAKPAAHAMKSGTKTATAKQAGAMKTDTGSKMATKTAAKTSTKTAMKGGKKGGKRGAAKKDSTAKKP